MSITPVVLEQFYNKLPEISPESPFSIVSCLQALEGLQLGESNAIQKLAMVVKAAREFEPQKGDSEGLENLAKWKRQAQAIADSVVQSHFFGEIGREERDIFLKASSNNPHNFVMRFLELGRMAWNRIRYQHGQSKEIQKQLCDRAVSVLQGIVEKLEENEEKATNLPSIIAKKFCAEFGPKKDEEGISGQEEFGKAFTKSLQTVPSRDYQQWRNSLRDQKKHQRGEIPEEKDLRTTSPLQRSAIGRAEEMSPEYRQVFDTLMEKKSELLRQVAEIVQIAGELDTLVALRTEIERVSIHEETQGERPFLEEQRQTLDSISERVREKGDQVRQISTMATDLIKRSLILQEKTRNPETTRLLEGFIAELKDPFAKPFDQKERERKILEFEQAIEKEERERQDQRQAIAGGVGEDKYEEEVVSVPENKETFTVHIAPRSIPPQKTAGSDINAINICERGVDGAARSLRQKKIPKEFPPFPESRFLEIKETIAQARDGRIQISEKSLLDLAIKLSEDVGNWKSRADLYEKCQQVFPCLEQWEQRRFQNIAVMLTSKDLSKKAIASIEQEIEEVLRKQKEERFEEGSLEVLDLPQEPEEEEEGVAETAVYENIQFTVHEAPFQAATSIGSRKSLQSKEKASAPGWSKILLKKLRDTLKPALPQDHITRIIESLHSNWPQTVTANNDKGLALLYIRALEDLQYKIDREKGTYTFIGQWKRRGDPPNHRAAMALLMHIEKTLYRSQKLQLVL